MPKNPNLREYQLDSKGSRIPDIGTGFKLTDRCLEAFRECHIQRMKGREPMDDLPERLRVYPDDPPTRHPERVQYGIPVTIYQLHAYAVSKGLCLGSPFGTMSHRARFFVNLHKKVAADLQDVCDTTLHSAGILSVDYDCIVALHDNYTWFKDELEEDHEKQVVEILQRELKTTEKARCSTVSVIPFLSSAVALFPRMENHRHWTDRLHCLSTAHVISAVVCMSLSAPLDQQLTHCGHGVTAGCQPRDMCCELHIVQISPDKSTIICYRYAAAPSASGDYAGLKPRIVKLLIRNHSTPTLGVERMRLDICRRPINLLLCHPIRGSIIGHSAC
ncbi:hypothetical protein EVG20_g9908 [Dentipellis fragilis]|uniref:Uncharacterized protein n=1 Tax=Dentipellis fragilis TaxID=205917 RepID=A0A4Y9XWX7_9AGAM|nr:hypothetical protein EVG20_g9908 [Dentipellis fragilis]